MRLLRQLRAVLWSFVGVRRSADSARDLEGARPRTVIALGFLAAAALVVGIVALVRVITGPGREGPVVPASVPAERAPPVAAKAAAGSVPDTMAERTRACTSCHGSATQLTGNVFSPRIAGKPADYLFNQLVSFRDGRRPYAPMVVMVRFMSDDYLREIARHFASLELPYPPPEPAALAPAAIARVRELIEHGDPSRDLPACDSCHGPTLAGLEPAIPGLLGLPRDYVAFQLGAWRNGEVRSLSPDCMGEIARRLAPADVPALAAWLAAQPVPAGAKAAPPSERPLPLPCGGVEAATSSPVAAAPAPPPSPQVERGRYLVTAGNCIACHTAQGGVPFAGGRGILTPFGTVYATNLTPDAATGLGGWTADDFRRALHEGRSRDGRLLYPAFPYPNFTRVTREDSDAMFAFLRTLDPVVRANTPHALRFPYDTQLALAAWRMLFFRPGVHVGDGARSAAWNRGAYLVHGLGHCDACHAQRNVFGAVRRDVDLGGGLIPLQDWFAPPLAGAHGSVAQWERGEIEALLATGVTRRGAAMGPMAEVVGRSTQHLSQADVNAIAEYLREPGVTPRPAAPLPVAIEPEVLARGERIYGEHCADCHGARGEGAWPAYPALAGNASSTGTSAANAIKATLYGGYPPVTAGNARPYGMPPYFATLKDADLAAVLTYVRTAWGNDGTPVTALDVERYRALR